MEFWFISVIFLRKHHNIVSGKVKILVYFYLHFSKFSSECQPWWHLLVGCWINIRLRDSETLQKMCLQKCHIWLYFGLCFSKFSCECQPWWHSHKLVGCKIILDVCKKYYTVVHFSFIWVSGPSKKLVILLFSGAKWL